jgi:hypothetical protein
MTDLVVQVRLSGKDDGLVGQLQLSTKEFQDLTNAQKEAAAQAGKLGSSTSGAGSAAQGAARQAQSLSDANEDLAKSEKQASDGARRLTKDLNDVDRQSSSSSGKFDQLGGSAKRLFDSFLSGSAPVSELISQTTDLGQSITENLGSTGKAGAAAAFMQGPWGAAINLAVSGVGLLALALLGAGDAALQKKEAVEELYKAIDDLNARTKDSITTQQRELFITQATAEAHLEKALNIRKEIAAQIDLQKQRLAEAQLADRLDPTGSRIPGVEASFADRALAQLEADRVANEAAVGKARENAVRAQARITQQLVRESLDPAAAATGRYQRQVDLLNRQLEKGEITGERYRVRYTELTRQYEAATDAARGHSTVSTTLADAQAREAAASGQLSRAQAHLNTVRAQARADLKAGTIDQAEYSRRVGEAEQGVTSARAAVDAARQSQRSHNQELRDAAKATREADRATRELQSTLEQVQRRFDPVADVARRYAETLSDIAKLQDAGKITPDQAFDYTMRAAAEAQKEADEERAKRQKALVGDWNDDMKNVVDSIDKRMDSGMKSAARTFRTHGTEAATAIADVIGGRAGNLLRTILQDLDRGRSGTGLGSTFGMGLDRGGAGGITGLPGVSSFLLGRQPSPQEIREWYATPEAERGAKPGTGGGFLAGFEKANTQFTQGIDKAFDRVFGEKGIFSEGFSKTLGQAFGAAQIGGQVGKGVTDALGIKGSTMGGKIGGALGSLTGIPGADIIGSIAGSVIGGLIKSTPRASATITSVDEKAAVAGNNAGLRQAASGLATSVQGGLQQIADTLGGTLGNFAVSIGVRDKNLRVDTSGSGITKTKKGAVDFGQDEGGAIAFAIADALADGAIQGLSPKVAQALRSNPDLDKAIKEALNVQQLETLLQGIDGAIGKTFKDLEAQIAERNRIAKKYGFDLVKLEEQNAKDRKAAFEQVLAERTGPLQALLKDLSFGNLFEGSLSEQRDKVLGEIAKAEADATAGKDGAAQQVADLRRQLLDISRNAFGTAGPEYASDLNSSRASAERIIALENERVKAQADLAQSTNEELKKGNQLADETNDQLAEIKTILNRIANNPAQAAAMGGGGGRTSFVTQRNAVL